ncbi:hypothetical protein Tco_1481158, partial [Tanacetum coccineum]
MLFFPSAVPVARESSTYNAVNQSQAPQSVLSKAVPLTNEIASSNGSNQKCVVQLVFELPGVVRVACEDSTVMPLNKVWHLKVFNLKECLEPMNLLLLMAVIKMRIPVYFGTVRHPASFSRQKYEEAHAPEARELFQSNTYIRKWVAQCYMLPASAENNHPTRNARRRVLDSSDAPPPVAKALEIYSLLIPVPLGQVLRKITVRTLAYGERLKGHPYARRTNYHLYCGGGSDDGSLDPQIVERLIHILDEHNELVQLFRTARDKCRDDFVPDFKIWLYNIGGVHGYELLTSKGLGGI